MRISDWSSDLCSSDFVGGQPPAVARDDADAHQPLARRRGALPELEADEPEVAEQEAAEHPDADHDVRSRRDAEPYHQQREDDQRPHDQHHVRSEEHTSELQSLMRISYAVFCLKKKKTNIHTQEK